MKKILSVILTFMLVLTLPAAPVFAEGDVTETADALKDYPDNYTEIYGISFNVTQSGGFYLAGIYIDNGSEANLVGGSSATFAPAAMESYAGSFGAKPTIKDLVDGEPADLVYLSTSPLFSEGASMAKARLYAPAASPVTVNGYTWLDKDGNKFVPTAKTTENTTTADDNKQGATTAPETTGNAAGNSDNKNNTNTTTAAAKANNNTNAKSDNTPPKTGDNSNTLFVVILAVLAAGGMTAVTVRYRKTKCGN